MKVRVVVVGLLLMVAGQLLAATKAEQIDALLAKAYEVRQFNGSVLVADASGVVFKKGYGYANFEWQIPNAPDVRFRLASVTKQFTSMAVMQLVADGKLKLDGKITDYLPDYRKDTGDRVTITHLLNHTSGIPSYTSQPGFFANDSRDPYTPAEFVKKFASGDLEFEPGSKFSYNNSAYFLLGAIIEKVAGKPYADVVQERIFTPLGMKSSGYDLAAPILPKRASGYEPAGGNVVNAAYLDMTIPYAAGSLYSTVEDLYLWDRALYTDQLLRDDLKKQLFTPTLQNYAFGWVIGKAKLDDGKSEVGTISHAGGINGFSTRLFRVPETKELVVLLDNTSRGDKLNALASSILSILHGIEPKQPRKSIVHELQQGASGAAVVAKYRELRNASPDEYDFQEADLNTLGYSMLAQKRVDDAIEIFKLNVELYPQSANPYDSLGEAYAVKGDKELALQNYRKSVELDPKNKNGLEAIARLEKPPAADEVKYPLEAFVGRYELTPTFILSFFIEDGKLMTQATGQPKLDLRADSATEFSVVGVPARVVFEMDGTKAKAVTLFQGGREMKAKRVE
ncbi:MAG TPA: serine hydrolase [Thermoanaerobaculia bacterium]|jgi:CubicO group peptidase (beta-lactamase class C family)|nr:serine hydrolase [Thermoanaerobaculia bacterium]